MSTVHCNTVETSSGGAVTLTKQVPPKHFLNYDFISDTTYGSFNQSSFTDHTTGEFTTAFTNNFSSIGYAPAGVASYARVVLTYRTNQNNITHASTTSGFYGCYAVGSETAFPSGQHDATPGSVVITGDLA
tara:strand:+ start:369 stop:761 length:393 start_codon:yes stop_codon:yes gene_type:complete